MKRLEADLIFYIEPQIAPFRGPIYFGHKPKPMVADDIPHNAGFGLVDTGEKKLLVTCNHVVDGFRRLQQEKDPELRFYLCLDLESKRAVAFDSLKLIDSDASLDLAVFDIEPLLSVCRGREFYPLHLKPPPQVRIGDKIVVVGNQGINRRVNLDGLELGESCYALSVSEVSQSGLRFRASLSDTTFEYRKPPLEPKGSPHGGISGSPCFVYTATGLVRLVGFACQDGADSIFFVHAKCVDTNGFLKR